MWEAYIVVFHFSLDSRLRGNDIRGVVGVREAQGGRAFENAASGCALLAMTAWGGVVLLRTILLSPGSAGGFLGRAGRGGTRWTAR